MVVMDKPSVETIDQRLDSMDKAIQLLQDYTNRMPTPAIVQKSVDALRELHDEKFASIQTQFKERDTRVEQQARESKSALDAALAAQKEAVTEQNKSNTLAIDKAGAAFTKQIDATQTLIQSTTKATDDKISDIKDRITTIESRKQGMHDGWGYIVGGIGVLVSILTIAAMFIGKQV